MKTPYAFDKASLFDFIVENGRYSEFIEFAWWMFNNRRMSIFNSALVFVQRPGATFVETEYAWERDYERFIKPDETPIVVMHPFGPINFLYELEDTYGKEFKKARQFLSKQPKTPLADSDLAKFKNMLNKMGIYYGEKSMGIRQYGEAEFLPSPMDVEVGIKNNEVQKVSTRYAVTVNRNLSNADKAKTILHEIGHILCGHLERDPKHLPRIGMPERKDVLTHDKCEFEAEKVCEIVCDLLGIEFNTDDYLCFYEGVENAPEFSLKYVIDAADKVIKLL